VVGREDRRALVEVLTPRARGRIDPPADAELDVPAAGAVPAEEVHLAAIGHGNEVFGAAGRALLQQTVEQVRTDLIDGTLDPGADDAACGSWR
jgi:hypothetical protein